MKNRVLVHLFGWGLVKHPEGDFTADETFYQNMRESFEFLTKTPGRAPRYPGVLRQHVEDGYGYGKVMDIFKGGEREGADEPGVWVETQLCDRAYEAWKAGEIIDWSPSFFDEFEDRHSDRILKNLLRELSFVSVGHLMNTKFQSPAYAMSDGFVVTPLTLAGAGMEIEENAPEEEATENMDEEEVPAWAAALTDQVSALVALLTKDAEGSELDDETHLEDDEADDATENAGKELAARITGLERQLASERRERAVLYLERAGINAKDVSAKPLIELAATNRDAFDGAVKLMADSIKANAKTTPKPPVDREAGGAGHSEVGLDKFRKLASQVKADGAKTEIEAIKALERQGHIRSLDGASFTSERSRIIQDLYA